MHYPRIYCNDKRHYILSKCQRNNIDRFMRSYGVRNLTNKVILTNSQILFRYSIIAGKVFNQSLALSVTVCFSLISSYHFIEIYN